jgi:hypothetical protein
VQGQGARVTCTKQASAELGSDAGQGSRGADEVIRQDLPQEKKGVTKISPRRRPEEQCTLDTPYATHRVHRPGVRDEQVQCG